MPRGCVLCVPSDPSTSLAHSIHFTLPEQFCKTREAAASACKNVQSVFMDDDRGRHKREKQVAHTHNKAPLVSIVVGQECNLYVLNKE